MRFARFFQLFVVVACVLACPRVYSDDVVPAESLPSNYMWGEAQSSPLPIEDEWWLSLNDSMLDSLIAEGIEQNFNLAMAAKRISIARQSVRQAQSGYYPTVDLSAGWQRERSSGYASNVAMPAEVSSAFNIGATMSWEVDLFGKIRSRVKESKANQMSAKAQYNSAMVSLCAEIATQYCALRTYQAEYAVAQEHIKSQAEVLKIAKARYEAELASKLDVAQASTVYYSTQSMLPQLESSIDVTINALAVLLGRYPAEVAAKLRAPAPLPEFRQIISAGIPMDLLRRRPDIIAAEYDLAASAASLGVAKKDFLPTLTIEGAIGTMSHSAKNLFKSPSFTYSVAPTLSWTVFDGFARRAATVAAKENMQMAMDEYNMTVLIAVQEVENALAQYYGTLRELDMVAKTLAEAEEAFKLSLDLYKGGLSDFTDVANAQISMLQYADRLTTVKGSAATQLINIYRSLGGGWNTDVR